MNQLLRRHIRFAEQRQQIIVHSLQTRDEIPTHTCRPVRFRRAEKILLDTGSFNFVVCETVLPELCGFFKFQKPEGL